jgi:hypothetical protein
MVAVATAWLIVALRELDSATLNVSFGSSLPSAQIGTRIS